MKGLKRSLSLLGVILAGVGAAMALTNPDQPTYDAYAAKQLSLYLEEEVCTKADTFLQSFCSSALQDNQAAIQTLISRSTKRQNYLLLSVYQTDLTLDPMLPSLLRDAIDIPSYHAETIGIFNQLLTYKVEEQ